MEKVKIDDPLIKTLYYILAAVIIAILVVCGLLVRQDHKRTATKASIKNVIVMNDYNTTEYSVVNNEYYV